MTKAELGLSKQMVFQPLFFFLFVSSFFLLPTSFTFPYNLISLLCTFLEKAYILKD